MTKNGENDGSKMKDKKAPVELWEEEKIERRAGGGTMIEKKLENGSDAKGSHGTGTEKGIQIREKNAEITEILGVLSDAVSSAIVRRIAETDRCSKEDLVTMDVVVEEGESVVTGLKDFGLIEVEKDAVVLTEKGRKVLTCIEGWNEEG